MAEPGRAAEGERPRRLSRRFRLRDGDRDGCGICNRAAEAMACGVQIALYEWESYTTELMNVIDEECHNDRADLQRSRSG